MDPGQAFFQGGLFVGGGIMSALAWFLKRSVSARDRELSDQRVAADRDRQEVLQQLKEIRAQQDTQRVEVTRQIEAARMSWMAAIDGLRREQGDKLDGIAVSVGSHSTALAAGAEKFQHIEQRLQGLEERERQRACFGGCRITAAGS